MFNCNIAGFDWLDYIDKYIRGLMIWVLREDTIAPKHQMKQLVLHDGSFGKSYRLTKQFQNSLMLKSSERFENAILSRERFMKYHRLYPTESKDKIGSSSVNDLSNGVSYRS